MSAQRVLSVAATLIALVIGSARASMHATAEQARQWALSMPQPKYPEAARQHGISGSGFFKLRVQIKTGRVKHITTLRSTGSALLDTAAIQTLYQWRFKPGVLPSIRQLYPATNDPLADADCFLGIPISFVLTSRGAQVH